MNTSILNYDIHLYGIFIAIILFILTFIRNDKYNPRTIVFRWLLVISILLIIFEIVTWDVDGQTGVLNKFLNISSNAFSIGFLSLLASVGAIYIDLLIFNDTQRIVRRNYYVYPFVIAFVLVLVNFFSPVLFTIDEYNVYSRGPLFYLLPINVYVLNIYIIYITIKNTYLNKRNIVFGVLLYFIIPTLAYTIQIMFYGFYIINVSVVGALMISYIMFESNSLNRDSISFLYNRAFTITRMQDFLDDNILFTVALIELKRVKSLNNKYGFKTTDDIIKEIAVCLRKEFKFDIISRWNGNELLILIDEKESITLKSKILLTVKKISDKAFINDYDVDIRVGIGSSHNRADETPESIINDASIYIDE